MSELAPTSHAISLRRARPGNERDIADAHAHSFVFGYECPAFSYKVTGHFVQGSRWMRRKVPEWGQIVRGELPDDVVDAETLVAKTPDGRIMGIGHAVVTHSIELARIELEALYLRPEIWGQGVGTRMHNLLLGRLAQRNTTVTEARALVAPYGNGWEFYNRPPPGSTQPAWRDIREVPAEESGSGFFGRYWGVPPLHEVVRDTRTHPIPAESLLQSG